MTDIIKIPSELTLEERKEKASKEVQAVLEKYKVTLATQIVMLEIP